MTQPQIRLDQIERRLGNHGTGGGYASYDTPFSTSASEGSQDGSILNSGFIATVFASFLLVGSGSFFFMGDQLPLMEQFSGGDPGIASVVDPTCASQWRAGANNSAALTCYVTTMPERFCDAKERQKLRALFVNYREELAVFDSRRGERLEKLRVKSVESNIDGSMGMFDALNNGQGSGSSKKTLKAAGKKMKQMKKGLRKKGSAAKWAYDEAAAKEAKVDLQHERAEAMLKGQVKLLIESGYLQGSDIGWFSDEILKTAFDEASHSPDRPCAE